MPIIVFCGFCRIIFFWYPFGTWWHFLVGLMQGAAQKTWEKSHGKCWQPFTRQMPPINHCYYLENKKEVPSNLHCGSSSSSAFECLLFLVACGPHLVAVCCFSIAAIRDAVGLPSINPVTSLIAQVEKIAAADWSLVPHQLERNLAARVSDFNIWRTSHCN